MSSFASTTGVRVTTVPDGCAATAIGGTGSGRTATLYFACSDASFSIARAEHDPAGPPLPSAPAVAAGGSPSRIEWLAPSGAVLVVVAEGLEPEVVLAIAEGLREAT